MTAASTRPSLQDVRKVEADIALEHGQWACAHCTNNLNAGSLGDIETVRKHVHATCVEGFSDHQLCPLTYICILFPPQS